MERILNQSLRPISLQVSYMGVCNQSQEFDRPVLLKNGLDENMIVRMWLPDSKEPVITSLLPGWNPELVIKMEWVNNTTTEGFVQGSLQYGY